MRKFKKLAHILYRLFETLVAFVLVIVSLGLYLLHDSPIDARFLMQEVEKTVLPEESGYHLQAEFVELGSDLQKEGIIQIEIKEAKLLRADGSVAVEIPHTRLAYDFWHLITLNYYPSTIILQQPKIDLYLSDSGKLVAKSDSSEAVIEENTLRKFIRHVMAFKHIDIQEAQVAFRDQITGNDFVFSDLHLNLARRFRIQERVYFDTNLTYAGQTTRLLGQGKLNRFRKTFNFELGFPSVYLKPLGRFVPLLSGMDFPVQFSLKGDLNLSKNKSMIENVVEKINFQIKSVAEGTLNLPAPLTNIYPVRHLLINGVLTKGLSLLKIDASHVELTSGTVAQLEASLTGLKDFLKSGDVKKLKTVFESTVRNIQTQDLPKVWPRAIGTSTHDWVASHLSKGSIPQADFKLIFEGEDLVDLYGDVFVEGVQVDYLSPMPPVQEASAHIFLYPDQVKIDVSKGHVYSLNVAGTDLLFTDVDIDPTWANVHLKATGEVSDIFKLLSFKPLEFTQEYHVDSVKCAGQAQVKTDLFFKVDTESSPDEVKVTTHADIQGAQIAFDNFDVKLEKANLALDLSNEKMQVSGQAHILGVPLSIEWTENFIPKGGIQSVYKGKGTFSTQLLSQVYPDIEKFVSGMVTLSLSAQKKKSDQTLQGNVELDATQALVNLHLLGQTKKVGQAFNLKADFNQPSKKENQIKVDIEGAIKKKNDLNLKGEVLFGKELSIDFPIVKAPENNFSLQYKKDNQNLTIQVKGDKWLAKELFGMPLDSLPDVPEDKKIRNVLLNIQMNQVVFNPKLPIQKLVVNGQRLKNKWVDFHAQADLKNPFILIFDSEDRQFKGAYSDFRNLLETFGFNTSVSDGNITLTADEMENGDLSGKILIQKLTLKDPGFMTQALTLLGILDAFLGNDIVFDEVEIPVTLNIQNGLMIQDGYASGRNLGLTFQGKIDDNQFDLKGSLVPAYAINSLPGKIPFVGWLFKNSEGGGLVNVPFSISGSLSDPQVTFHPLGTMRPGFLGNLF